MLHTSSGFSMRVSGKPTLAAKWLLSSPVAPLDNFRTSWMQTSTLWSALWGPAGPRLLSYFQHVCVCVHVSLWAQENKGLQGGVALWSTLPNTHNSSHTLTPPPALRCCCQRMEVEGCVILKTSDRLGVESEYKGFLYSSPASHTAEKNIRNSQLTSLLHVVSG